MNYATIKWADVANGPGVRVSLFVSGCTHRCEGCFNQEAWDFQYGHPFGQAQVDEILQDLSKPYIKGLSLLGGEPFHPDNQSAVLDLVQQAHASYPNLNIWCYSGYLFQDLAAGQVGRHSRALLEQLDILVDGPFVAEKKNLSLRFRGSENQRIIQVQPSLARGEIILWDEKAEL